MNVYKMYEMMGYNSFVDTIRDKGMDFKSP